MKLPLALAAQNSRPLLQLDGNNAFLNGDLHEDVYMQLPQGYVSPKGYSSQVKFAWKLQNSLYGLKQSSRQWYEKFSSFHHAEGFMQSKSDYSLFYKGFGSTYIALLVYVDDIVLTGASLDEINNVKTRLTNEFKLKDLGNLKL